MSNSVDSEHSRYGTLRGFVRSGVIPTLIVLVIGEAQNLPIHLAAYRFCGVNENLRLEIAYTTISLCYGLFFLSSSP